MSTILSSPLLSLCLHRCRLADRAAGRVSWIEEQFAAAGRSRHKHSLQHIRVHGKAAFARGRHLKCDRKKKIRPGVEKPTFTGTSSRFRHLSARELHASEMHIDWCCNPSTSLWCAIICAVVTRANLVFAFCCFLLFFAGAHSQSNSPPKATTGETYSACHAFSRCFGAYRCTEATAKRGRLLPFHSIRSAEQRTGQQPATPYAKADEGEPGTADGNGSDGRNSDGSDSGARFPSSAADQSDVRQSRYRSISKRSNKQTCSSDRSHRRISLLLASLSAALSAERCACVCSNRISVALLFFSSSSR